MKVRVNGYCRLDNENHRASVSGGGGRRALADNSRRVSTNWIWELAENLPRLSELAQNLISSSYFLWAPSFNFFNLGLPTYREINDDISWVADTSSSIHKFYESLLFSLIWLTTTDNDLLQCHVRRELCHVGLFSLRVIIWDTSSSDYNFLISMDKY